MDKAIASVSFLKGGGEMGELTRNYNWSQTSLGSAEQWPQSLRTTLSIVLNSKFPMFLFWGADHICFYNDAFRPSLGNDGKHPFALGKPGADVWTEIWTIVKPMIDQVVSGGEAIWSEDQLVPIYRNGKIENVYWTFSYSLVSDESGNAAGVFVACSETTEKLATLKPLKRKELSLELAMDIGEMGVFSVDLSTGIATYAQRIMDWFELDNQNIQFTEIFSKIHTEDQAFVKQTIEQSISGEWDGRHDIIYRIVSATDTKTRFFRSIGQVLYEEGKPASIAGIIQDVTAQVQAKKALEESENKLRSIIAAAPAGIGLFTGRDLIIEMPNQTFIDIVGKGPGIEGKPLREVMPELLTEGQPFLKILDEVFTTGVPFISPASLVKIVQNGVLNANYYNIAYAPLYNAAGEVYAVLDIAVDVTDSVKSKKALEQSEQRFQNLIREATVGIIVLTGEDMKVTIVNNEYGKLINRSHDELIGKPLFTIIPETEAYFRPIIEGVQKSGEPLHLYGQPYFVWVGDKKKEGYLNLTYQPFKEGDGTAEVMVLCQDVTEQVRARKAIEESEQQVRSLVESAPFPIAVYVGKEMRIQLANQSIIDIWGKGNQVIGKLYAEVLPELDNQQVFKQLDDVFTTGVPFHARNQHLNLVVNGKLQPYYFNYSFTPVFDAAGKVYGVMNTGADVTELNISKLKLQESEQNLRVMVLQAPVAICIFKGTTYFLEIVNPQMAEMLGRSVDVLEGKPFFEAMPEVKGQGLEAILKDVMETGTPFYSPEQEFQLPREGKMETVYVKYIYEPLKNSTGIVERIMVVALDITQQVLARQKIEEMVAQRTQELAETNRALQQNNRELEQFAYIASHDLQEPLRKVSTFTEMLKTNLGEVDERSKMYLDKITASSSRMMQLIKDVLNFSQLSKEREMFEPVDLNNIVENIIADFELLIEQKGASVTHTALPVIEAIPLQMRQLFGNLVSNALKFTKIDTPPVILITSRLLTEEEKVLHPNLFNGSDCFLIEVTDNGIGFSQEYAEKIFGIFQRLHGKTEYAGTGIGLALCKKIAQTHCGEIWATSALEQGTVFHVVLPKKQKNDMA